VDLDLDCVSSFLALLEEENYGRAARRLYITTPALTKRIQRLEQQVGVQLVVRDAGGVGGATLAGMRFAAEAKDVLAHAKAAFVAARTDPPRHPTRSARASRPGVVTDKRATG